MQNKLNKINQKTLCAVPAKKQSQNVKDFKKHIQDLTSVADKFTVKVVNSKGTPAKRISMLMEVNKLAKSVYEGLIVAMQKGKVSKEDVKSEVLHIKKALSIIREGYKNISAQQKIIKGYRKNLDSKTKNYLEELANVDSGKLL